MRDIDWLFLVLTLFNTDMGLYNTHKNNSERRHQDEMARKLEELDKKLDRILEGLKDERGST